MKEGRIYEGLHSSKKKEGIWRDAEKESEKPTEK